MFLHVWDKAGGFLHKIGGVLLVGSILIWLLQSFPRQGTPWLEQLGHFVAPVFSLMGFGWQEIVALLSGFIAKEVVAASLVVVYHTDKSDVAGLQAAMGENLAPASGLALGGYLDHDGACSVLVQLLVGFSRCSYAIGVVVQPLYLSRV